MALRLLGFLAILLIEVLCRGSCSDHYELQDSYWSRSSSDPVPYSLRTSHIGPIPHINEVMTEWANWEFWGKCSRSCGGGVRSRTRRCVAKYPRVMPGSGIRTSHDHCTGETVQYEVCGTQQCPAGQVSGISFRAAQCRHHNNRRVLGRVINSWVPYTQGGINPCALVCEGEGEGIVYTFGKVTDGTYCKTEEARQGLCVSGRCLRLSCDGRLGGSAFEDMCRVCGGKNDTCTRHSGIFHSERPSSDQPFQGATNTAQKTSKKIKSYGYYEVTKLPSESTNIKVIDNSSNFLALKSGDKYLLNGDWLIDWPGEIDAAGVSFTYSRKEDQSEALTSLGPTNSDLALMVLLREANPGIYYEYWTRNTKLKSNFDSSFISNNINNIHLLPTSDETITTKVTSVTSIPTAKTTNATPLPKTNSFPSSFSKQMTAKSKLKPAILNGFSFNKTFSHAHSLTEKLSKESKEEEKEEETEGSENVKEEEKEEKEDAARHVSSKSVLQSGTEDLKFGAIFNLKKSTSSKLPSWRSNSVYDVLYPTKTKVEEDRNYSMKTFGEDYSSKRTYYEKKKKKKKKKKRRRRPAYCKPCLEKRKAKHSFCTSDFVSRVQILNEDAVGEYWRLEAAVLQSYKNKVPLLHREFLWQHVCSCRRLRLGRSYIVMGVTEKSRGNEVKLMLRQEAFVKRFSHKILSRVMRIRQNEMKFCRPWRRSYDHLNRYSYNDFLKQFLNKRSQTDASAERQITGP